MLTEQHFVGVAIPLFHSSSPFHRIKTPVYVRDAVWPAGLPFQCGNYDVTFSNWVNLVDPVWHAKRNKIRYFILRLLPTILRLPPAIML